MTVVRSAIQTDRLRLEPRQPEHAEALFDVIRSSLAELSRWFAWAGEDLGVDQLRDWCEHAPADWERGEAFFFSVFAGDLLVGTVGLDGVGLWSRRANLAYFFRTDQSGRGFASEAGAAVVEFAFKTVGLTRIEIRTGTENTASLRVAEKLGFRREGLLRGGGAVPGGGRYDCYAYGRLATDGAADDAALDDGARVLAEITEPHFAAGLVTAVAQHADDSAVLMVAYMNEEAYQRTLATRRAWFWSRSRNQLWEKGETSGNFLDVDSVTIDCDGDAVLLKVHPHGPACHTGARSCFHNPLAGPKPGR